MTHGNALDPARPTPRLTALVVDDTDVTRQRLRRILSNDGYEVVEASNGRRALLLLASPKPVALIVLDLVMPHMSGWEFRRTQLTTPGLADIPTVLMTSTPLTGHERFLVRAQAVVVKPFEDADVTRALGQMIPSPEVAADPLITGSLLWSKDGRVMCSSHAPERGGDRWTAEGWTIVAASMCDKYTCQQCGPGPIKHRRRSTAVGASSGRVHVA